jgi:hypothetical protein
VEWIRVARGGDQWWTVVNVEMTPGSKKRGESLSKDLLKYWLLKDCTVVRCLVG